MSRSKGSLRKERRGRAIPYARFLLHMMQPGVAVEEIKVNECKDKGVLLNCNKIMAAKK